MRGIGLRDLVIGAVAGFTATLVADRAAPLLHRLTPEREKAREPAIPEGSSSGAAARLLCEKFGYAPSAAALELTRRTLHYGLGMGWGPVYCFARQRLGLPPAIAGILAGTSLSLCVDEMLNSLLGTTPPSHHFPLSAHLRGLLTHLVWGSVAAAVAEMLYGLERRRAYPC
jgi:uncharacterized membrane protein YagU involved in acid resistance